MNIFGRIWAWLTKAEKQFELEFADITKSFTNTVTRLETAADNEWVKVRRHQATIDVATAAKMQATINARTAAGVAANVAQIFTVPGVTLTETPPSP